MTKTVRVENADTSNFGLVVEVWDKGLEGRPDVLSQKVEISHPTALATLGVTSTRYLVVRELPAAPPAA